MKKKNTQPYKVRLPGFMPENEIGLGDVIKQATSAFGIKTCNSCEERANKLNKWFLFTENKNQQA